ncbi:Suppressor of variegation 2-10, isoform E,related [Neospora caninum Liverpool]|uniref:Suppressor of variegation 2-10, isoform E,related n=1 Tax=Neospora caninum (strain Liverpool) TaxID=572307 RepID=F0VRG3_NEOCL|nr:Suppressor of variegation 2-10, isoform E,related [Neospora caninum Liverpool]CBZ56311.1 Suppressor of variegation 2-10, isoform E,related [Neospora caninum Liverpool]CEL71073.1 TPA: Suppressor of variegation 2-10, isoform E,related [Neospora caninum Liverpool]|eukprot:XP_003886336.1 Suppressor of variegation 2-10, isoform E,related [Neospora caninum Liverpool]
MLSIEQLHAHTCAELVGMCRELGLPHSGRRKQVLVQALYDYQRSNGGIPPQVVSRFAGRTSHAASRFSHAPHAMQAPSAHGQGSASAHAYIPPYSSQGYQHSAVNLYPPAAPHHASAYHAVHAASRHQTLLAGDGLGPLARSRGALANGGNQGASEGPHAGDRGGFGAGKAAQNAGVASSAGNEMFGRCLCRGTVGSAPRKGHTPTLKCILCNAWNHAGCYPADYNTQDFVCSMCRMKRLDPFFPVAEVLWDSRLEQSHYVLELNTQQLRKWRAEGKEVIVRCMQVDIHPLYQSWPKTMNIVVNGRVEETVAAPSWEHKRRDMPIPITQYLKNSRNRIEFTWTNYDEPQVFHIGVFLCDSRTPDSLSKQVWQCGQLNEPEAEKRVLDIINNRTGNSGKSDDSDDDDDVMCLEVTRRIKLLCPVTFTRIEVPCRGRACMHLQCYDLAGYLLVTKNTKAFNTRWKCPECHLYVRPDELVIDGFVQKILSGTDEDATVVELQADASFRVVTEDELKEESKRAEKQRQLASGGQAGGSSPEGELKASQDGPAKKAFEVVEMLSDSDEDEAEASGNATRDASAAPACTAPSFPAAVAPEGRPGSVGAQRAETPSVSPASSEASGPSLASDGSPQSESEAPEKPATPLTPSKIRERSRLDDDDGLPPQAAKRSRRVVVSPVSSPTPLADPAGSCPSAPPDLSLPSPSPKGDSTAALASPEPSSEGSSGPGSAGNSESPSRTLPGPLRREEQAILVVLSSDDDGDSPGQAGADKENHGEERKRGAGGRSPEPERNGGQAPGPSPLCFKQKQEFPPPEPATGSANATAAALGDSSGALPAVSAFPGGGESAASRDESAASRDQSAASRDESAASRDDSATGGTEFPGFALVQGLPNCAAGCPDTTSPRTDPLRPMQTALASPHFSLLAGAAADNPISVSDSSDGEEGSWREDGEGADSQEGGSDSQQQASSDPRKQASETELPPPSLSDSSSCPSSSQTETLSASRPPQPPLGSPGSAPVFPYSAPSSSPPPDMSPATLTGGAAPLPVAWSPEGENTGRDAQSKDLPWLSFPPSRGETAHAAASRWGSDAPPEGDSGASRASRRGRDGEREGHADGGKRPRSASDRPVAGVRRARAPVVPPPLFLSRSNGTGDEGRKLRQRSGEEGRRPPAGRGGDREADAEASGPASSTAVASQLSLSGVSASDTLGGSPQPTGLGEARPSPRASPQADPAASDQENAATNRPQLSPFPAPRGASVLGRRSTDPAPSPPVADAAAVPFLSPAPTSAGGPAPALQSRGPNLGGLSLHAPRAADEQERLERPSVRASQPAASPEDEFGRSSPTTCSASPSPGASAPSHDVWPHASPPASLSSSRAGALPVPSGGVSFSGASLPGSPSSRASFLAPAGAAHAGPEGSRGEGLEPGEEETVASGAGGPAYSQEEEQEELHRERLQRQKLDGQLRTEELQGRRGGLSGGCGLAPPAPARAGLPTPAFGPCSASLQPALAASQGQNAPSVLVSGIHAYPTRTQNPETAATYSASDFFENPFFSLPSGFPPAPAQSGPDCASAGERLVDATQPAPSLRVPDNLGERQPPALFAESLDREMFWPELNSVLDLEGEAPRAPRTLGALLSADARAPASMLPAFSATERFAPAQAGGQPSVFSGEEEETRTAERGGERPGRRAVLSPSAELSAGGDSELRRDSPEGAIHFLPQSPPAALGAFPVSAARPSMAPGLFRGREDFAFAQERTEAGESQNRARSGFQ